MTKNTGYYVPPAHTTSWITPSYVLDALGRFDLDPCVSIPQPWPTAERAFTIKDDGLRQVWRGRVWLNPPYANKEITAWMQRMAEHNQGTALVFARVETAWFFDYVWKAACAVLFVEHRLPFHTPGGERGAASPAPSVLCAYGQHDANVLATADIPGAFVDLRKSCAVKTSPTFHAKRRGLS